MIFGRRWEPVGIAVLGLIVLQSFVLWLDNVHIATLNGLFKSLYLQAWITTPASARLEPSNYLYFPAYGLLCRFLDWIGVDRNVPWRQLAVLNAAFASIALATVYVFIRDLTGRRDVAALATLFHLGCGFFLLLAVINEDIMPGYTLVLSAMALAAARFDRPTPLVVVGVAVLFTFGWLFEWRLIFPTLPALLAAIAVADVSLSRRFALGALLLAAILATAGLVVLSWEGHTGAVGLHDVLWTGKGIATGWAGFSLEKCALLAIGMGQYLLGGRNVLIRTGDAPIGTETVLSLAVQFAALGYATVMFWRDRRDARLRCVLAVFLGTLCAGVVMNAYSQPQDPQMQINVMPWLTVIWALALARTLLRDGGNKRRFLALTAVSALPLLYNAVQLSQFRGGDTAAREAVAAIDGKVDLERTVFLYWGFEPITGWQHYYGGRRWDGLADLGDAPDSPRVKWITVVRSPLDHTGRNGPQNAAALKADIDWALDHGYRVVVGDVWQWSASKLARALVAVSAYESGAAIHAMLHDNYVAKRLFDQPGVGTYYELSPRKQP